MALRQFLSGIPELSLRQEYMHTGPALGYHRLPDGRKLKRGYTTGTCAAAAARGALQVILGQGPLSTVTLRLPGGTELTLPLEGSRLEGSRWTPGAQKSAPGPGPGDPSPSPGAVTATCGVRKDAGDDPDITGGMVIFARVELNPDRVSPGEEIIIQGGEGVGRVTRPGLALPPGEWAINPGPREQIKRALEDLRPPGKGLKVTISIPGGEKLARQTLNPDLGIEGGLSVLGTTGIVEPMSQEALKESLALQVPVAREAGYSSLVLVPGRRGQRQAEEILGFPRAMVLQVSNFVGFFLDTCAGAGIREVLLCGSPGKLAKVAGGIFHTHNRVADGRRETVAAHAALEGAPREVIKGIMGSVTAEGAGEILREAGLLRVFDRLAEAASTRVESYCRGKIKAGTVLLNSRGEILGVDRGALEIGGSYACPCKFPW